ncbi:hypothetical protein BpHYR1_004812, partial [Brachionus plicatilis]
MVTEKCYYLIINKNKFITQIFFLTQWERYKLLKSLISSNVDFEIILVKFAFNAVSKFIESSESDVEEEEPVQKRARLEANNVE